MFDTLGFSPSYTCEWQPEIPGGSFQPYCFEAGVGQSGLYVKVWPEKSKPKQFWYGLYGSGSSGVSGAYACPNPSSLCVVAWGEGYILPDVRFPQNFVMVACTPIRDVRGVPDAGVLICASFCEIVAYGVNGLLWCADRVVSDDLQILEITATHIRGKGYDAPKGSDSEFIVDIRTGRHS